MKKILLTMCFFASVSISAQITSASNGNWNDTGTWTGGVVPTITDDVVINHTVEIARNGVGGVANSITCNGSPAQIVIRENTKLTVTGDVTLTRSNDAIIIYGQFAGTKTGTMIFGGTYTASRKTRLRKRLTDSKWHLIGNPFLNPRVDHTTEHADTKLRDNGTVLSLASYDDSTPEYVYYTNVTPLGSGPKFGTAQGYSISVSEPSGTKHDYVMQGVQHSGSVSYTLSTAGNGFNLLGNPYISYLHANDAADATNNILRVNGGSGTDLLDEDTIWLWDGDNDVWITKNLNDAAYRINPLQGFFVKAKTAGAFSFTKNMETHDESTGDAFLRSSNNRFEIDLSITNNELIRKASIRYVDNTSTSFDNGYDSSMFGGYASILELYTGLVAGDSDKKLAIQSLPNENYEAMIVPVGITATANSEITFTADAFNIPTGYKVFLEDRVNNTFTRLDEADATYTATVSETSTDGRFFLHTTTSVLSAESELLNSVSVYKRDASTLKIVGLPQGNTSVKLYTILGENVMSANFNTTGVKEISLPKLSQGVYIVQLETETGKLNKKIVLE